MRRGELPVPVPGPEEVGDAADEILSRSEFRRPAPSIFERIEDEVTDAIGRAFESLLGSGAGTVLAWIVLGGAVALAVYFTNRFRRTVTPDRASGDGAGRMIELTRSPSEWRAEADVAEAEGRWKDGLLARYRALVGSLVAAGVLDDVPGRTSGEYRIEVRARRPDARAAFDEATALFEQAWYGDEPTGPAERDRFVMLDLELTGARR